MIEVHLRDDFSSVGICIIRAQDNTVHAMQIHGDYSSWVPVPEGIRAQPTFRLDPEVARDLTRELVRHYDAIDLYPMRKMLVEILERLPPKPEAVHETE